jgi:multiple sugar transport system permease protein
LSLRWENFVKAWNDLKFLRVLRNTLIIAIGGDIGTLLSCTLVAYGFSRFRFPGKDVFLVILISSIILPGFVTLIPTYALFQRLGWVGTYAPLIIPHFFANAYNVFLLRQYFLTIPKEMDEAAMIDGASPFRTLLSVILPQSIPVVVAVAVFHFIWAWNDYFGPLIYLSTKPELQPLSVAIQYYNQQYVRQLFMVQATAMLGLVVPVVIFFIAQRAFMRGVVVTGVEK